MARITRFEDIRAWQTARELTKSIYDVSGRDAFGRDYGLRNQIRRASVSVMSNIAEGFESGTRPMFIHYLGHAKASSGEVRSQLYVALDVGYLDDEDFKSLMDLADKASRQLSRFIAYLKSHPAPASAREEQTAYIITPEPD